MAETVYILCAIFSAGCAILLARGYKKSGTRLLLWAAFSFGLMALNNIFLYVDLAMFPEANLNGAFWRNLLGAGSGSVLLIGLIWELV